MRTIDLHCDTVSALLDGTHTGSLMKSSGQVDVEKLRAGGVGVQFFACYFDKAEVVSPYAKAKEMIAFATREIETAGDDILLARGASDIGVAEETGRIAAFLTIEEGGALEGDMTHLSEFYGDGVRLMTLTWNYPNEIGYSNIGYRDSDKGLSPFGREVVLEMERMGMIVDVSHLSDRGFYDVAELMTRPFVASHSNTRSITDHPRNLTDDMIRRIALAGGVIGLNFANLFLGNSPISLVSDMVRHVQHIYRVGGAEVLALGTDFDGIDPTVEIQDASKLSMLWDALHKAGMRMSDIEKMQYQNARRVLVDCLK